MLQRLKHLFVILLLMGFAFQPVLAGSFTQEDFEYIFANSPDISPDNHGLEPLSEQEMRETKGEIAPAVVYAAIVAARMGVQIAPKVLARLAKSRDVQKAVTQHARNLLKKQAKAAEQATRFAEKAKRAEAKGNLKQAEYFRRKAEEFTEKATKPLLGKNPRVTKSRTNTDLPGGKATAKSIFRNQTKGQRIEQKELSNGGLRRWVEDGPQIRFNPDGSVRVDLPNRGPLGTETIHFGR